MAENDRFERALRGGWRTAAQYVTNENASPEEVDDKLVESLTRCLQEYNGVPGFQEIVVVLKAPLGSSFLDSFCALDDIVRDRGGHRHTKIAANEAKSLLVQLPVSEETLESKDLAHRFAEDVCLALVRHNFVARARPQMIAERRFVNHEEFCEWQVGVERSIQPRISKIAAQLVGNPNAVNLRAPRKSTKKVPTGDLLNEVLV